MGSGYRSACPVVLSNLIAHQGKRSGEVSSFAATVAAFVCLMAAQSTAAALVVIVVLPVPVPVAVTVAVARADRKGHIATHTDRLLENQAVQQVGRVATLAAAEYVAHEGST